jgi:protein O-mannosyl-transferase
MELTSDIKKESLYIFIILVLVAASYYNSISNGFVFDDVYLVYQNPFIKDWHNIPKLFHMDYWQHAGFKHTGLYRPLTMLSFLIEYIFAGLKPRLYHIDNIVLHFLCSVLVYFNLKLMLKEERVPIITALLFAAHPVHTESVAWISGRAELLWSFFALLSSLFFLKKPSRPVYVLSSSFFFLLALLAKEGAIVLPVILAAYLVIFEEPEPGTGRISQLIRRLYPLGVVFAIYMPARLLVLKAIGPTGAAQIIGFEGPYEIFLTMSKAFTHYIRLSFLPFNLTIDYMFPTPESFFRFVVLMPLFLVGAIAVYAGRIMRYSRTVFFGIAVFFIALLPVSNIIPIGIIMSERAMYIPVLGPCMIVGVFISRAYEYELLKNGRWRTLLITAVILLTFIANSVNRNPFWSKQKEFLEYRINVIKERIKASPGYSYNYYLLANASIVLNDFGPKTLEAALESARIAPDNPYTHYLVAQIYTHESKPEQALKEVMASLDINPDDADTLNLAANILHMLHRDKEAEKLLDKAFSIGPVNSEFYLNKGYILIALGETEEALSVFESASKIYPEEPQLFKMQGMVLGSMRRYEEAVKKLRLAEEISDDDPEIYYLLGVAYFGEGDADAAAAELKKALKLKPGYKQALDLLQKVQY